jgi:hypothetical protein
MSIMPVRPGGVAADIRNRLNTVLGRAPGYQAKADQVAAPLTPMENMMIAHAPPEMQAQIRAQIQQRHQQLAQSLKNSAASINRPFSPADTSAQMGRATQQLKDSVNKTFDALGRQLGSTPMPLREQFRLQQELGYRRATALQAIDAHSREMGRSGASFQDVLGGKQNLEKGLQQLTGDLASAIIGRMPPEKQGMARAELEMNRMNTAQALHNQFSAALQPSSPTEFNQLPGGAPPMTGRLTEAQAKSTLGRLETGIQAQFQARLQEAAKLPPEMQGQARFDAEVQRDRQLVSAYRNVLSRVSPPVISLPPPVFTTR